MVNAILGIIGSILLITIGLWKYFTGKARAKKKRQEDAANEIKQGMDENDPSKITGGLDNLNRH